MLRREHSEHREGLMQMNGCETSNSMLGEKQMWLGVMYVGRKARGRERQRDIRLEKEVGARP